MAGEKCRRCTVTLYETDFAKGLAVRVSGKPYCKFCTDRVSKRRVKGAFWNRLSKGRGIGILLLVLAIGAGILVLLLRR